MFVFKNINSEHLDLIHDVKYDYYGRRMVTCSSDQIIKIWELSEDNQDWNCISRLQGHNGSVWKVDWAHPEYGQVIASCGFDRTISIWEEITSNQSTPSNYRKYDWVKRAQLVDPRTPVTDIQFAPRHLGLQLASCSTDGMVRLYEAQDVMDLSQWTLQYDFQTSVTASCLSWSKSPAFPTLLAVGNCNGESETKVILYELNEQKRNCEQVYSLDNINGSVHDLSFAPCMGHSFHTIAVAADHIYIFYIKPIIEVGLSNTDFSESVGAKKFEVESPKMLGSEGSKVWRVTWNVTGTLLASSEENGCVRLWRRNYQRNWTEVHVIVPEDGIMKNPMVFNTNAQGSAGTNGTHTTTVYSSSSDTGIQLEQQHASMLMSPNNQYTSSVAGYVNAGMNSSSIYSIGNTGSSNVNVPFQKRAVIPNRNEITYG